MASVLIKAVDNGYIVQGADPDTPLVERVWQGGDTLKQDVEAFATALWDIIDRLGMVGTKHDVARVRVVVEPGSDFVDEIESDASDTPTEDA